MYLYVYNKKYNSTIYHQKKRHFFDEYFNWERLVGAMMHDDDDDMFERETFSQLSWSPQGVLGQANENQNYSINFNFNRI